MSDKYIHTTIPMASSPEMAEAYRPYLEAAMQETAVETPKLITDPVPLGDAAGRLIEPNPLDVVLCTYPSTLDGFAAAWVVRKIAKSHNIPVEFQTIDQSLPDLADRNWIALGGTGDWSTHVGAKSALVFSRLNNGAVPVPFAQWKRTFPFGVETMTVGKTAHVHAAAKSLAVLAWDFFHADRIGFDPRPRLFNYLDDVVTGAFKLNDSRTIVACVESYPTDFGTFDRLVEACDDRKRRDFMAVGGEAILRHIAKQGAS